MENVSCPHCGKVGSLLVISESSKTLRLDGTVLHDGPDGDRVQCYECGAGNPADNIPLTLPVGYIEDLIANAHAMADSREDSA